MLMQWNQFAFTSHGRNGEIHKSQFFSELLPPPKENILRETILSFFFIYNKNIDATGLF
jgi:hypothetical protein